MPLCHIRDNMWHIASVAMVYLILSTTCGRHVDTEAASYQYFPTYARFHLVPHIKLGQEGLGMRPGA